MRSTREANAARVIRIHTANCLLTLKSYLGFAVGYSLGARLCRGAPYPKDLIVGLRKWYMLYIEIMLRIYIQTYI